MENKKQILVVEDNEVSQVVIRIILERAGYVPIVVNSGPQALRAFAETDFELVILECNMPGLDGFETAAKLRALEGKMGGKRSPILGISPNPVGGIRDKCVEVGIDDILGRPFRAEEIVEKVNLWSALATAASEEVLSGTIWQ